MRRLTFLIRQALARVYWRLFKPQTRGARLLLINRNRVLLVRPHYSKEYYLPGGQVKRNETFMVGLRREIKEELGITPGKLVTFGRHTNTLEGKRDTIEIFLSQTPINFKNLSPNSELAEATFFPVTQLPDSTSPGTQRRIQEFLTDTFPITNHW